MTPSVECESRPLDAGARRARSLRGCGVAVGSRSLASPASYAVERIVLEVDEITSPATQAAGTSVTLDLARGEPVAHVRIGQVAVPSADRPAAQRATRVHEGLRARTDHRLPRRDAHGGRRADEEHHAEGFGRVRHGASRPSSREARSCRWPAARRSFPVHSTKRAGRSRVARRRSTSPRCARWCCLGSRHRKACNSPGTCR